MEIQAKFQQQELLEILQLIMDAWDSGKVNSPQRGSNLLRFEKKIGLMLSQMNSQMPQPPKVPQGDPPKAEKTPEK